MLEISTAIFLTLMGSAIYHLLPTGYLRLRISYVAALSFIIVFAHYPVAALAATTAGICAWLIALGSERSKVVAKYGPFSLIVVLALFSFRHIDIEMAPQHKTLLQFGMSFYILRLYLALRTSIVKREVVRLEEYLAIALFFPIFPAGPICAQEAFTRSAVKDRSLLHNYLTGLFHIGIGIFALYFVNGLLESAQREIVIGKVWSKPHWAGMDPWLTYSVMMLKFLSVYANFAGYTKIAIGLGLFFGFQIPENFRYPFLATNIQKFWQRWHLSLSKFITNQIYLPIMLSLRKPRLSMFMAFTLVGLWHEINLQYLLWGVGHGGLMALYMSVSRHALLKKANQRLGRAWSAVAWLMTMSAVAFLSTFANEPTWGHAMKFCYSLFGLGGNA